MGEPDPVDGAGVAESVSSPTGTFADQAQLRGQLDRLRDLGIHLVSVNPVD